MTTLPQPSDCCNPCAGARTACVVECGDSGGGGGGVAVATTIDLRAFPGPYTYLQLISKISDVFIGDGFGMTYYFDTSSFDVDNGANVVKPDSINIADPGRWLQYI